MNQKLQKQIIKLVNDDQRMRFSGVWNPLVDIRNTQRLKKIIARYGWPDIKQVGKKASNGAFLLAQHADHDKKFQKKCLKFITLKLKENTINPQNFAYLTDRVLINSGQKQLYGTQFYFNKKTKKFGPRPIKNKKKLLIRRRQMKLGSFLAYSKLLTQRHNRLQKA